MNLSRPFIRRPIASALIAIAIVLLGALSYTLLPVAPLPQVDFPTIQVYANLPGASPETMASSVATPLERALGSIAGITGIRSNSSQGSCNITLEFDFDRDIDDAARDVQAALNAARGQLPSGMPRNPSTAKSTLRRRPSSASRSARPTSPPAHSTTSPPPSSPRNFPKLTASAKSRFGVARSPPFAFNSTPTPSRTTASRSTRSAAPSTKPTRSARAA